MSDDDLLAGMGEGRGPEPRRDRWGRPLIPHPVTGKEQAWTRVTTYAKSISDTFGLAKWQTRMAVKGVTARADLFALAAATPTTDSKTLDRLVKDAQEAAGSSAGANQGTALHSFTEAVDRGEKVTIPEPWASDVAAYRRAMHDNGLAPDRQYIERMVVIPELGCAGTFDRLLWHERRLYIGDLKTAKDFAYGHLEIAIQLAMYSRGAAIWNPATETYESMPKVSQETAVVMHLPVGQATCKLYAIDIAAGWKAAQLCKAVRFWRSRRDLATPWDQWESGESLAVMAEIENATTVAELEQAWERADKRGTWTSDHTDAARKRKQQLQATAA